MLVIYNAKIPDLFTTQPSSTSLAIEDGTIKAVGSDETILSSFSNNNIFNAEQLALIPGLIDAHIHLESYALSLQKVDCDTSTQTECLQRVAERAMSAQAGEWILGHGWNQNDWDEGYGTAQQLDDIDPHNPIYLTHKSLHSAWVNSAALHMAGIDNNSSDPIDGKLGRGEDGLLNGIVYEAAMDLIESAIPEPSLDQVVSAIKTAQQNLWKVGLTGLHDFDRGRCFSALQVLHQQNELNLRVLKGIPLENLQNAIELGLRSGFGDDMLRIGSVKLFADGALGPHTAAMLQPYEDDPHNTGMLMLDQERLFEYGQLASRNGISMAVHAIGDRANHEVLNAYAQLRGFENENLPPSRRELRHRIEHVQVLHPEDARRFSDLKIIASMQPIHATSDMLMSDKYWGKRSAFAYAWRMQLDAGSCLIFGSDAPVESPNPFWGIYAAITRRRADGKPTAQGWYPEQRLTVSEALAAYTTGPAFAAGNEDRFGKIAPGHMADLILLNKDPFSCSIEEINNISPLATMVNGEWVFSKIQ